MATAALESPISEMETEKTPLKRAREETPESKKTERKKKIRKTFYRNPESNQIIVAYTNVPKVQIDHLIQQIHEVHPDGTITACILENQQVRIGPSSEQLKLQRKEYIDEYRTRPAVIQKRKEKANDPEEIRKKQAYAARPDVKKKKRELAKETRLFKKKAKEMDRAMYDKCMDLIKKEFVSSESSSTDSSDESNSAEE